MEKSKVYFTKNINSNSLVEIYNTLNKDLNGKVAIKISTGEKGNNNYLNPLLIKDLVQSLNGTIVECNTAYAGKRNTTKEHLETAKEHGFFDIANVDIMDSEGDIELPINGGKHLKVNYVGKNLKNYDSILILSHFKGHPMGGFGGALKNMSIGIASSKGKCWIHSAGKVDTPKTIWKNTAPQDVFLECMGEADKSVIDYFKDNIAYINVINNLSVDCDCVATPEKPCMHDIGIAASLDPVALDKACLDLIYNSTDEGREHFIKRVETKNGKHIIDYAVTLKIGNDNYELINIDKYQD